MAKFKPLNVKALVEAAKEEVITLYKEIAEEIEAAESTFTGHYQSVVGTFEPKYPPLHAQRSANGPDKIPYTYKTKSGTAQGMRANYNKKRAGSNPNFETSDAPYFRAEFKKREQLHQGVQPEFKFKTVIDEKELTLRIEIESIVKNRKGRVNNLYYWRDRGLKSRSQQSLSPFWSSGSRLVRLQEGMGIPALPSKNYSEKVGDMGLKYLKGKYPDMKVAYELPKKIKYTQSYLYKKLRGGGGE